MEREEMDWIALECSEKKVLRQLFYGMAPSVKSTVVKGEVFDLVQDGLFDEVFKRHGFKLSMQFVGDMRGLFPDDVDEEILSVTIREAVGDLSWWDPKDLKDIKKTMDYIARGRTWKKANAKDSHLTSRGLPASTTTTGQERVE